MPGRYWLLNESQKESSKFLNHCAKRKVVLVWHYTSTPFNCPLDTAGYMLIANIEAVFFWFPYVLHVVLKETFSGWKVRRVEPPIREDRQVVGL